MLQDKIEIKEDMRQLPDATAEKPQIETVEPYEVKAYVTFDGVQHVDEKLHLWMAKQMLEKDPEIFNRKLYSPIFYKLLSFNADGRTGIALTNEPNVSHVNFFITVNERTVHSTETIHFVNSEHWSMRAHSETYLTEEQTQELKLRHERIEERHRQEALDEERSKQLELDNYPTVDTPFELATWNLLVSNRDFPATEKYKVYEQAVVDNTAVFGWWDGEQYFAEHRGRSPIRERKPDFQLVAVDQTNKQATVKEFTPCPVTDKENYNLAFVVWVGNSMECVGIKGIAGMSMIDMQPFLEAKVIFDEQQAILRTLKEAEVGNEE